MKVTWSRLLRHNCINIGFGGRPRFLSRCCTYWMRTSVYHTHRTLIGGQSIGGHGLCLKSLWRLVHTILRTGSNVQIVITTFPTCLPRQTCSIASSARSKGYLASMISPNLNCVAATAAYRSSRSCFEPPLIPLNTRQPPSVPT